MIGNPGHQILQVDAGERGAVLILTALLGMALLMFVAYAIDLSVYANAREAAGQYSRLAALSAIEGYYSYVPDPDDPPGKTEAERQKHALLRANQVSMTNRIIDGQSRRVGAANILAVDDPAAKDSDKPVLTPGRWYFRLPTGQTESDIGCKPPCFTALSAGQTANAMQIRGTMYTSTLSNLARAAFGTAELPARISATASVVPRHGCFLVDLSPSVTGETHLSRPSAEQVTDGSQGHGRIFGFFLGRDNEPDPDSPDPTYKPGFYDKDRVDPETGLPAPGCNDPGGYYSSHDCWFDVLEDYYRNRPGGGELDGYYAQRHYADDYIKLRMMGDNSWQLSPSLKRHHPDPKVGDPDQTYKVGAGQWVHVDAFRNPPFYDGPQSLEMILSGLKAAIQGFQKRAVAGDQLCLIFYDRKLAWPRIVQLTDDFGYLLRFTTTAPVTPPVQDALNINDAQRIPAEPGFQTIVRHGIFPANSGFTNMALALGEASNQLARGRQQGVPSSDFVVLIGDGLTNCTKNPDMCGNTYDRHKAAMAELHAVVDQFFVPAQIPVHVIMAGESVAPHTVARKHTDGRCYTSAESRKENLNYVIGGDENGMPMTDAEASDAFDKASPEHPYFQVNADMYRIAAATNGLWAPIRKSKPGDCTVLTDCSDFASPTRLLEDPKCRTVDQQMDDYMNEILGLNPYALVDLN